MQIDIDKLREDIKDELMGVAFGGGYGGALMQTFDVDKYSDEQVIRYAMANGMDLSKYTESF